MKRTRKIFALLLCFILVASMAATAYAIDAKALGSVYFHSTTSTSVSTRLGLFTLNEILRVESGVYDSYGKLWWYGKPDPNTGIYQHYGYAISGYSRADDDNGVDLFTFSI